MPRNARFSEVNGFFKEGRFELENAGRFEFSFGEQAAEAAPRLILNERRPPP